VAKAAAPSTSSALIIPGLLLLFVLPLLGYSGYTVADRWYQGYRLTREEMSVRADIARLREENIRLQAELKDVRGDAYIEGVAREQLGLVKPGDRAIVIVGPPPPANPAAAPERASVRNDPNAERPAPSDAGGWQKILDAIFGR